MTKPAFKPKTILWIDLEMTGLDPDEDRILEVGAIVTDWDFKEIAQYEAVQHVDQELIDGRMIGSFWDEFPQVKDQLEQQNQSGKSPEVIEAELMKFINQHFDRDMKVLLAGNSIHQDRKFIDNEWPRVADKLHYRMLDVSAWKVVMENKYKKKFAKPEAHRALSDIRGSIEELQYYLKKVKI